MKLLITGASGFLGRYVVAEALQQGYEVRAGVRSIAAAKQLSWSDHPSVEFVELDLQQSASMTAALQGVDAVIHLVAALRGDYQTQYQTTVVGTEALISSMIAANVRRLIGISSFSVYDYFHLPLGATINENSAIEPQPQQRDGYAQTKLIQESRLRQFGQKAGQVTILRPGIIYGKDHLWNASLGMKKGDRLWVRIGSAAELPLTYVENCAAAIVAALARPESIGKILNVVDDDRPTQQVYATKVVQRLSAKPITVTLSWEVMNSLAKLVSQMNQMLFRGKLKLPGIFIPARLHARFKPLHYSNNAVKTALQWQPRYSLDTALDRSLNSGDPFTVPHPVPLTPNPQLPTL